MPRRGGHASASGPALGGRVEVLCRCGGHWGRRTQGHRTAGGAQAPDLHVWHWTMGRAQSSLHLQGWETEARWGGQSAELDAPPACPLWAEGSLPQAHLRYPFRYARAQMWALSPLQPNPSSTAQSPPWGGPGSSVGGTRAERPCRASAVPTQHWSVGTGRMCKGTDSLGQVSLPTPGSRNF